MSHTVARAIWRVAFLGLMIGSPVMAFPVMAQEWTRFRGPNGSGESETPGIPAQWKDTDYHWKVTLPGVGHSSPVVWGDRIFLLSAEPKDATRHVMGVAVADGKMLWHREYPSTPHHLHTFSSYASCTPAVDESRVYVAWSAPEATWLKAFSHEGVELWSLDLGTWISQHGFGTSPMVYGELVILTCSQEVSKLPDTPAPQHSFVVAVDRGTGQIRWKTPRKVDTASFSVPCVYQPKGGPAELILCSTAEGMFSLDPETGRENWALGVFDKRTVSSPLVAGGLLIGTTGSGGGGNYVAAVRPGSQPELAYKVDKQAPYVPSPVCRGDLMFLWSDKGIVTCVQTADGKPAWEPHRIGGNFFASPVRVADKLYNIDDEGTVVVLAADRTFRELGRNPLGEASRSTPAVAGGRMYLRTFSHLFSLGGPATPGTPRR